MTVSVDGDRLWRTLAEVSAFGETAVGGLHRLAASSEDGAARDYLVSAARSLGCTIRVDAMGNIFARRRGSDPEAKALLVGSHLDSQPMAGKYDGPYGVIAGLEVLATLHGHGIETQRPVEVVCWTNEEGARFAPAMMGSAYYAGKHDVDALHALVDSEGATLGESLLSIGYLGDDVVSPKEHACYLELHIEQGPLLQNAGIQIGVVTSVQGMHWRRVRLRGQAGHAGTYPMDGRRDALVAAARIVSGVNAIGVELPTPGRATVGQLTVAPNSPNVVPGAVDLMVEFRHPEPATLATMSMDLDRLLNDTATATGVDIDAERVLDSPTVTFDAGMVDIVASAAEAAGVTSMRMVSGAGHDACQTAPLVPTAMIFIPCDQGISHAEQERITRDWAVDGANVLLQAVLLADRA